MNRYFIYTTIVILGVCTALAFADVPQIISYQGRLTDSLGNPVVDGSYQITFSIYDDPLSGPPFWTSGPQSVEITGGLFEYQLGSAVLLPVNSFDSDTVRYLGITVGDDDELTPRIRFTSVAYAYRSMVTDTAAIALSVDEGVITSYNILNNTIQLIDLGQNGASTGQIIKWNGSSWQIADDLAAAGWSDDGSVVRLETTSDSVGIGTSTPQAKLDVAGQIRADAGFDNINAIEGYVDSDATAIYGANAIGTDGGLGGVDAGVWGSGSGSLWAGQFYGKTWTSGPFAIGTNTPATLFHMHGADPILTIGTTTDFAGLRIRKFSSDVWELAWDDINNYLYLKSFSGGGTPMVIEDATGEVGFGTTTPSARVHAATAIGYGQLCSSNHAVYGQHFSGSYGWIGASGNGVYGHAPGSGYGVKGDVESGYAVYGATSDGGYGVFGINNNGPYGYLGGTNYAVYGYNPASFAGYFNGNVRVTEKLGIGAPGPLANILHIEGNNPIPVINSTGDYMYWTYKINDIKKWDVGYNAIDQEFFFDNHALANPLLKLKDNGNVGINVEDPISTLDIYGDIHIRHVFRGLSWPVGNNMLFGSWNGTTFTERLRIASDGTVGIGATSPADKLHVAGNIRLEGSGAFLRFVDAGNLKWSWLYKSWAGSTFQLYDEVGGRTVMAFEPSNGNVGINTVDPNATLDVNGDVNVTGNLTVSGSSPFPAPNYDSGWLTIGAGQEHVMTHNLGVDANKYVVDFQMWGPALETNNYRMGSDFYYEGESGVLLGAFYKNLNTSTITLKRASDDYLIEKVRVRIWVYQ